MLADEARLLSPLAGEQKRRPLPRNGAARLRQAHRTEGRSRNVSLSCH